MKRSGGLFVATVALLVFLLAQPAMAGGKKRKAAEQGQTLVQSVSATALTVTVDKEAKTFPINPYTEITIKGQKAAVADLAPGQVVHVTLGLDGVTASRINVEDTPPEREAKEKVKMPKGWMK